VLLGSSNSATVEFLIPEKGSYIMVDHHFANASQGAIGLIEAGAGASAAESEHHNIGPAATPSDPEALRGKLNFESKCLACHAVAGGEGKKLGPDMLGVTRRHNDQWLARWLKSPEQMIATDATAKALLQKYNNVPMPNQNLSDAEIREFLKYFRFIDASAPKAKPVAKK
jgi:nitrite reductase (NO-forming)